DISDGLARDAAHIAERSGVRLSIELERVPLAPSAELDDLGFGEDYELLATTPDPLGFTAIGRVEEGEGVALTLEGKPYELAGWGHFPQPAVEMRPGPRADPGAPGLSTGEQDHGRDREHVVAGGECGLLVDVDAGHVHRKPLEDRLHGLARPAPGCPEIDDDGSLRAEHDLVELAAG